MPLLTRLLSCRVQIKFTDHYPLEPPEVIFVLSAHDELFKDDISLHSLDQRVLLYRSYFCQQVPFTLIYTVMGMSALTFCMMAAMAGGHLPSQSTKSACHCGQCWLQTPTR